MTAILDQANQQRLPLVLLTNGVLVSDGCLSVEESKWTLAC